jgi:glycosyltransferase involved in cell wall biosynthesis
MKTACLINNYNYADFVPEAVDSALRQSVAFDEIVVVDDGSTDGSRELLARRYGRNPRVKIVTKRNEGQLSCFNEGLARSAAEVLFFLDADDVFEPNYLEQALDVYQRDAGIDFVFCGHRLFGQREGVELCFNQDRDLGYSVVLTTYLRPWIGAPTSCLSMRRAMLEKFLPLPFLQEWRTRADDCLVFGASLAGARKYFLAQPLVRYRVHDRNHFFGRKDDIRKNFRYRLAINQLFQHLERKLDYNVQRLGDLHRFEFLTIENPTFEQLKQYLRISRKLTRSTSRRLKTAARLTAHFLRARWRPVKEAAEEQPSDYPATIPFTHNLSPKRIAGNSSSPHRASGKSHRQAA